MSGIPDRLDVDSNAEAPVLEDNATGHAGGASGPTIIQDAIAASRAPVCSSSRSRGLTVLVYAYIFP